MSSSSTGAMENQEQELRERAALLMEALGRLPPDAVTLSALFDVAVSAAVALTFDPSAAGLLFAAKLREFECKWGPVARGLRPSH